MNVIPHFLNLRAEITLIFFLPIRAQYQSVTNCHQLKLPAADGQRHLTDVANAETLLRLVQSVPSQSNFCQNPSFREIVV